MENIDQIHNVVKGNLAEHFGSPLTAELIEALTKQIVETLINLFKDKE